MSTPRVPEGAIRDAIEEIDELEFIDRGGQGDAWRIRRDGRGNEILKVVLGDDAARVAREIDAMKGISHPRVMRFSEQGTLAHDDQVYPYIVGEFVTGKSIAKRLEADDWPSESQALRTIIESLRGLAEIHGVERIHRDFKPANIALREDDWNDPVILDLGLVRDILGDSITVYPSLLGTIPYMAPEQLRRERAVRRSDVFAAGVTLFVLLAHRHPFLDGDEQQVALEVLEERIRDSDRPDWSQVSVPDDVREVLARMLAPDAYERPRASFAADALQAILGDR
jgi:serine/threonine protein kinase